MQLAIAIQGVVPDKIDVFKLIPILYISVLIIGKVCVLCTCVRACLKLFVRWAFFAFINDPNALAVTWSHVTSD